MTSVLTEVEPLAEPFDVEVDPVRKLFWDAADLIEKEGWIRGKAHRVGEGWCMIGALHRMSCSTRYFDGQQAWVKAVTLLENALHELPVYWNDHQARSKDEVVSVLRKLADAS